MGIFKKKELKKEDIKEKVMQVEEPKEMPPAPQAPAEIQQQYAQQPGFPPVQPQQPQVTNDQLAEGLEVMYAGLRQDLAIISQNILLWNQNMLGIKTEIELLKNKLDKKK